MLVIYGASHSVIWLGKPGSVICPILVSAGGGGSVIWPILAPAVTRWGRGEIAHLPSWRGGRNLTRHPPEPRRGRPRGCTCNPEDPI